VRAAAAIEIDSAMLLDPKLDEVREVFVFSPRLKPLWIEALTSKEHEQQQRAADAIARAHQAGMKELDDAFDPLLRVLEAPGSSLSVRLAAARALVELDAQQSAHALSRRAIVDGLDMAMLVEPALAAWDYAPRRTVWRAQLNDPAASRRRQILAIRALATVRDAQAVDAIRDLALDPSRGPDVRLEAARAQIAQAGLADSALQLLSAGKQATIVDRLVAAELACRDASPRGVAALDVLLDDPEPAVVAVALSAADRIAPQLALKRSDELIHSDDANLRRLIAKLLVAHPTEGAVKLVGSLLTDPQPALIDLAGESLAAMATHPELIPSIHEVIVESLNSVRPATVRQAVLLVGAIRAKEFAGRTAVLLDAPESEVAFASAWALRVLADPSTELAILARIEGETKRRQALVELWRPIVAADPFGNHDFPSVRESNAQLEQLILALGALPALTAEPLLRRFLPKPPRPQIGEPPVLEVERQALLRAAAIWSLGRRHAESPSIELVAALRERLADANEKSPEAPLVRRMAAISLGRMKDVQSVDLLRALAIGADAYTDLGRASRWALEEITSEKLPKLSPLEKVKSDWFLTPLN